MMSYAPLCTDEKFNVWRGGVLAIGVIVLLLARDKRKRKKSRLRNIRFQETRIGISSGVCLLPAASDFF
jgi:hypothetical protein